MAARATEFPNPPKRGCYLGEDSLYDLDSMFESEITNTSTTEQIEVIYQQLRLPTVPRKLENEIKFTIYISCIKNKSDFLGLEFVEFGKKLISFFMSTFGFPCAQACEIMLAYANNTGWLFTFDIKLSDLIVFDWYGFFSEDVSFHLRELERNTELSLLHRGNPLFEEANKLLSDITRFIKPEYRVVMLCYIYLINYHTDFVIRSYSGTEYVNQLKELFKIYSTNKTCTDLDKMLTEIIYSMEFPDNLYE